MTDLPQQRPHRPVPVPLPAGTAELTATAQARIVTAIEASRSEATRRAQRSDWKRFEAWCAARGHHAFPAQPVVVSDYLTEHAETIHETTKRRAFALSTLRRWLSTINYVHDANGLPKPGLDPGLKATVAGLARLYARDNPRKPKQAAALMLDPLRGIIDAARNDATSWRLRVRERRDSAILLVGWAGGMRRSEITALTIGDIRARNYRPPDHHQAHDEWLLDGLTVDVRMSKTDQTGEGQIKVLPTGSELSSCAPCALIRWLRVLAIWHTEGRVGLMREFSYGDPVLRHICHDTDYGAAMALLPVQHMPVLRSISRAGEIGDTAPDAVLVHRVVRQRALAAGWTAVDVAKLSAHSLRAGLVTEGFERGATPHEIKQQTGHTSDAVLASYARHTTAWDANAVTRIGM